MKISFNQKVVIVFGLALTGLVFAVFFDKSSRARAEIVESENLRSQSAVNSTDKPATVIVQPGAQPAIAPFIVTDTENDSPGTNIVTRIVTFTAEIGGTPLPTLQWKLDKGAGFVNIPGATRSTYRIGNAQVSDSGNYALFATNSAGNVQTTPVPLIVTEGVD